MKVTLTIELDLPDSMTQAEAEEALNYSYVTYVSRKHAADAVKHAADAVRWASGSVDSEWARVLCNHHSAWSELASEAKLSIKF